MSRPGRYGITAAAGAALLLSALMSAPAAALDEEDRKAVVEYLEDTAARFVDLASALTEEQVRYRPAPGPLVRGGDRRAPRQGGGDRSEDDPGRGGGLRPQARLVGGGAEDQGPRRQDGVGHRVTTPLKAPEFLRPQSELSGEEALRGFEDAREATLAYVRATDHDLRSHFAEHVVIGTIDGVQWLLFTGSSRRAAPEPGRGGPGLRGLPGLRRNPQPRGSPPAHRPHDGDPGGFRDQVSGLSDQQLGYRSSLRQLVHRRGDRAPRPGGGRGPRCRPRHRGRVPPPCRLWWPRTAPW